MESVITNKNKILSINEVIVLGILVYISASSFILFLYMNYIYPSIISSTINIIILIYLINYIPSDKYHIRSILKFGIVYEIIVSFFHLFILPILATMGG